MSEKKALGPWCVKRPSFGRGLFIAPVGANSVRQSVAKVFIDDADTEEECAALLAAAPEIRDALRNLTAAAEKFAAAPEDWPEIAAAAALLARLPK